MKKSNIHNFKIFYLKILFICISLISISSVFALIDNMTKYTQINTAYSDSFSHTLSKDWKNMIPGFNAETLTKITFQKVNNLSEITKPTSNVKDSTSTLDVLATYENNEVTIYFTSTKLSLPADSSFLFSCQIDQGLDSLTTIEGMTLLDTSNVTNMANMFCRDQSLQALDLSSFDTSNVTKMNSMFITCWSLQTINLSSFDTSNVTSMGSMFAGCHSLQALTFPSTFNTSKVTNMYYMFEYCKSLQTLDLSNFDTSNVTNMAVMFFGCYSLQTLDLHNFDLNSVILASFFLTRTTSLTQIVCPYNIPEEIIINLEKNFYRENSDIAITALSSSVCSTPSTPLTLYSAANFSPTGETPIEEDPIIPPIEEDPETPLIPVTKPVGNSFVYDGLPKTFITNTDDYEIISGTNVATDVNTYILTLKLKEGRIWHDLTSQNINVCFEITKKGLSLTIKKVFSVYGEPLLDLTIQNIIENYSSIPSELLNSISFTKEDGLNAGLYDIYPTCSNPNYYVSFSSGLDMYEITKKQIHVVWYDKDFRKISGTKITATEKEDNIFYLLGFNLPENINIQYYVNDEPIDFICLNEIGTYTIRAEISGDYANFELLAPNELQVQIKEKSKTLIYVLIAFGSIV